MIDSLKEQLEKMLFESCSFSCDFILLYYVEFDRYELGEKQNPQPSPITYEVWRV